MSEQTLLFFFLILFSCTEKANNTPVKTDLEQKVEIWYKAGLEENDKTYSKTQQYVDSIMKFSPKLSNDCKAMGKLLLAFNNTNKTDDAIVFKNLKEAEFLLKNSRRDDLKIKLSNSLGNYYKTNGELELAFPFFLRGLKLAETIKDTVSISGVHCNIGSFFQYKGDVKNGMKHLSISMQMMKDKKLTSNYLIASHLMANFYGMTGKLDQALALDEEGLLLCDSFASNSLKAPFLDNKATCFFFTNQIDSAQKYFQECLRIDKLTKNIQQQSDSYANLANVALFKKNQELTLQYIDSSILFAQKTNYLPGMLKAYEVLIDNYKAKNDYQKLSQIQEKKMTTYKAFVNEKKENSMARYQILYETDKKEKKILESKLALGKKEKLLQSKNNMLLMLGIITLSFFGLAFLIYNQLKLRNQQQVQEYELKSAIREIENQNSLQEQRLRISRDLHDNIGAQLTFIISSVENINYAFPVLDVKVKDQLERINNFAKMTIIDLRDTIWAMNSKQITGEDLKGRIYNFIEKAKESTKQIKFSFTINEQMQDFSFSSIKGINVYRILQEAINNSLKYAEATEIKIHLDQSAEDIFLKIEDNGKGFSKDQKTSGNGLKNMAIRMEEIDGKFDLKTTLNQGTVITISCPKT